MKISTLCGGQGNRITSSLHGQSISINYIFTETFLGGAIIASTALGLCFLGFAPNEKSALEELRQRFKKTSLTPYSDKYIDAAIEYLAKVEKGNKQPSNNISLHLVGTPFQLKVWQALLEIPYAEVTTYSHIANNIGEMKAVRAVASAIGKNPISIIIPCHRVIRIGGKLGGYHWGLPLKTELLKIEHQG